MDYSALVALHRIYDILDDKYQYSIYKVNVQILGYDISKEDIKPTTMTDIENLLVPTSVKALQRFIGAIMFYQWLIPSLPHIMAPLLELTHTKRKRSFTWLERSDKVYRAEKTLTRRITNDVIRF